jgi:hypothetical protein
MMVIALIAAVGLTRLMKSLLFGISPLDPVTYAAVPVVLIAAAAFASYLRHIPESRCYRIAGASEALSVMRDRRTIRQ